MNHFTRTTSLVVAFAMAAVMLVSSCAGGGAASPTPAGSPASKTEATPSTGAPVKQAEPASKAPVKVRVGSFANYAAQVTFSVGNFAGKDRVTFENVEFKSAQDVLTALSTNDLDIGSLGYVHFLRALDSEIPVVGVSGNLAKITVLVARKGADISKVADLKGKKVGVPTGSVQDLALQGILKKNGMDPTKDIEVVNVPFQLQAQALEKGEVDAAITVADIAALSIAKGWAHHLYTPTDIPIGYLSSLMAVRKDFLAKNPDAVQEFVTAMYKGNEFYTKNPDEAVKNGSKWAPGTDPAVLKEALNYIEFTSKMPLKDIREVAKIVAELKMTKSDWSAKVGDYLTYDYVTKASGKTKEEMGFAQ